MTTASIIQCLVLLVVLAAAVISDLRRHRIANALTLPALLIALALQIYGDGWIGLGAGVLGALIGFAALVVFYVARVMGAGDVKLLAVTGAFLGPHGALIAAVTALIAGGVGAIGYVGFRAAQAALQAATRGGSSTLTTAGTAAFIGAQNARRERLPYALPIAIGGCVGLYASGAMSPITHWVGQ